MIFKEYLNTQEFAQIAGITVKTVGRLKKEILKRNPNTTKINTKKRPHKLHHSLLKEYLSPEVYEVFLENKSLRNTIQCLRQTDSMGYKMFQLDWTWWCTVSYKDEFTPDQCRCRMDGFYHHILDKFGNNTNIRMYYTTESFNSRQGNHNHFVFDVTDPKLHFIVKQELEEYLKGNRIEVKKYDESLPCIFYSEKEGLKGTAWDIWGNNLEADGLRYAN
jgi:hypothetical protein